MQYIWYSHPLHSWLKKHINFFQTQAKTIDFPEVDEDQELFFPESETAMPLSSITIPAEGLSLFIDYTAVISALSQSPNVQLVTGLDESFLRKRLEIPWTPENALRDCKC